MKGLCFFFEPVGVPEGSPELGKGNSGWVPSALFFGGGRFGSRELPKDNSSFVAASLLSGRIGSLPLFCLTRGAGWLLHCAFSIRSSSRRAHKRPFSC